MWSLCAVCSRLTCGSVSLSCPCLCLSVIHFGFLVCVMTDAELEPAAPLLYPFWRMGQPPLSSDHPHPSSPGQCRLDPNLWPKG